jgi:PEGA domain-containing protein
VSVAPPVMAPPRLARSGRQSQPAWWIAAAFAVLAIAEGGIIANLVLRSRSSGGTAGLGSPHATQMASAGSRLVEPSSFGVGSGQPVQSPAGGAAVTTTALNAASVSQLEINSDPPGARVTVDDKARGSTPVTLAVSPGPHAVVVSDGTTNSRQTVNAVAGATATLLASFGAPPMAAGWLSIHSPLDLQVHEGQSLIGVSSADRLMMAAGRHVLDLSNADAAFQTTLTVVVEAGKTTTSTVAIPNGSLSLNALPWANVTLDGQALAGTTPFANLEVPLGPHEVVWRHPQFGERRQTVMVTAKGPVRLQVDLRVK